LPLGDDGTLVLFTLEPTGRRGDLPVSLDALERACTVGSVPTARVVVLVADADAATATEQVRARGFSLALALDDRDQERFTLAHGEDFARPVEELAPDVCAVRVRWHPDDEPDVKKAQALGLTKLGAWLHETDRHLLIELTVPPTDADLEQVAGDVARYERDHRPGHTLDAVREIRDLGTEADLWSVPASADREAVAALDELVRDGGRDRVGVVVEVEPGTDDARLRAAAAAPAYRGVSLRSSSWSEELASVDAGALTHDEAARTIGDRLAAIIDLAAAAPPD
jgi:myo-inositol catabolism protein IolC